MSHPLRWIPFLTLLLAVSAPSFAGKYPEPSPYPISWELSFHHATPKRIVVDLPGKSSPAAFWYLTYNVKNDTDQEQMFLPTFELVSNEGTVVRSDANIPPAVFQKIKEREGNKFLEPANKIAGVLRIGEDQSKDGVAIWREPNQRMGTFTIFVSGLSGEFAEVKGADGKPTHDGENNPVYLRKTLQVDYAVYGDDVAPSRDEVHYKTEKWVMR